MKKLLLSLLLFLLLPVWCLAEMPAIYRVPHGLKDSTVILHFPAKYYYSPMKEAKGREVFDLTGICKDYTGDSDCYLLRIDNSHERNVFLFEKTQAPFVYVTTKPEKGVAGITIVGGWNEN